MVMASASRRRGRRGRARRSGDRRSLAPAGRAPIIDDVDRAELADFLRRRREALRPQDVGLPPGQRRRTSGLRREEVATLSGMSTDYYTRLEQQRGPRPSEQLLAAIVMGLRLTLDDLDRLSRLVRTTASSRV